MGARSNMSPVLFVAFTFALSASGVRPNSEQVKPEHTNAIDKEALSQWLSQKAFPTYPIDKTALSYDFYPPCVKHLKFERTAKLLADHQCTSVGEVGGGVTSVAKFYQDSKLHVNIDPATKLSVHTADGRTVVHLPMKLQDFSKEEYLHKELGVPTSFDCVVILGWIGNAMFPAPEPDAEHRAMHSALVQNAKLVVIESRKSNGFNGESMKWATKFIQTLGFKEVMFDEQTCPFEKGYSGYTEPEQLVRNMHVLERDTSQTSALQQDSKVRYEADAHTKAVAQQVIAASAADTESTE